MNQLNENDFSRYCKIHYLNSKIKVIIGIRNVREN